MVVIIVVFASCASRQTSQDRKQSNEVATVNSTDTLKTGKIITATITNKEGVTLTLRFNNAEQTCKLELNGEKIELKQERMASGIRYSNEHFVYTEWHREIRLYKDGKLIFSHDE